MFEKKLQFKKIHKKIFIYMYDSMVVLTMKDIIVHALLEDNDGPHYEEHYCLHIIGGP